MLTADQISHRLKIAAKIPFMEGLSAGQIDQVLKSGKIDSLDAGQVLCNGGDRSNALWVLLAGKVSVVGDGFELAEIEAVEILGEMGVITGLSRSATMITKQDVVVLEIPKLRLELVMREDIDLERKLYRNMLRSLCEKLRSTSSRLAEGATAVDKEIMASLS